MIKIERPEMFSAKHSIVLLFLAVLVFGSFGSSAAPALMSLKPGQRAPDFQARTVGGEKLTLSSLRGRIIVLTFWERNQDYSEKALVDLERIHQEYQGAGVMVLAINADEASETQIEGIGTALKLTYPLATDVGLQVYGLYGVIALPTTVIIGPEGKLAHVRPIHTADFYQELRDQIRFLRGEITRSQLEEDLYPQKLQEESPARKKASRYLNLGQALLDAGLREKALKEVEKAAEADPSFADPHILLARIYMEDKETGRVGVELEQALRLSPGPRDIRLIQSTDYMNQGKYGQAISVLEGLVKNIAKPPPEAYFQMGKIYEKENRTTQALEAYRIALDLIEEK